jgi:hypothetical protein
MRDGFAEEIRNMTRSTDNLSIMKNDRRTEDVSFHIEISYLQNLG